MKKRGRWRPALLAVALIFSLFSPLAPESRAMEAQAADAITGTISATVRLDFDQSLAELRERQVRVELLQGSLSLGTVELTQAGSQNLTGDYVAAVTIRDAGSGELTGQWPGYLDVSVGGLPRGTYTLRFSGRGYTVCQETVVMEEYAHHIIVGTGSAAFSLGDCNGDGRVDQRDRDSLAAALDSGDPQDLAIFDLNGDGVIDIIDLAYVDRQIAASGGAQLLETTLLAPPVNMEGMQAEMTTLGTRVTYGNLEDLFRMDGAPVTLTPNTEGKIVLPITFHRIMELEQLKIDRKSVV